MTEVFSNYVITYNCKCVCHFFDPIKAALFSFVVIMPNFGVTLFDSRGLEIRACLVYKFHQQSW